MNYNKCYIDLPYPEVDKCNEPRTVALLKEDYAGIISEFSAVAQYSFQDFYLSKMKPEIAETLSCIAKTEMKHLELLGVTIKSLGGDPTFENRNKYWNAGYVNYATNPREMIMMDIKGENEAIAMYKKHISMIDNKQVKALLERIIMDEELHIKLFNSLLNTHVLRHNI